MSVEKDFSLNILPTECSHTANENSAYTVRLPLSLLQENSDDFTNSLLDTAHVAFGHNAPQSRQVFLTCPEGSSAQLAELKRRLEVSGCQVKIEEKADDSFIEATVIKKIQTTCVDRRLDDLAGGEDGAQVTHPAGLLFLHPEMAKLLRQNGFGHHPRYLTEVLEQVKANNQKITEITTHVGVNGGGGCGGIGVLNQLGANINEQATIVNLLLETRDAISKQIEDVIDSDCEVNVNMVGPEETDEGTVDLNNCSGEVAEFLKDKSVKV